VLGAAMKHETVSQTDTVGNTLAWNKQQC